MKKTTWFGILAAVMMVLTAGLAQADLVSSKAEVTEFKYAPEMGQLEIQGRVCPPYFFGSWVSGSSLLPMVRQAMGNRVRGWQQQNPGSSVQLVSFNTQHETNMWRSAKEGNRCTAAYSVKVASKAEVAARKSKWSKIKIGVRDGFPMISAKDGNVWNGADILFAQKIAQSLGATLEIVEVTSVPKGLSAVEYGMTDLMISLVSKTPEREAKYKLSKGYFETGIVAASLNPPTVGKAGNEGFNSPKFTALVAQGTTAEKLVREQFNKMKVKTFAKTPDVYAYAKQVEEKTRQGVFNGMVMITDETIASIWPGSLVIHRGGKRLYSSDSYVVVAKDPELVKAVNAVIDSQNIKGMYMDLVGR
jgi:ABC-type amino acid transport substrate-binding protein